VARPLRYIPEVSSRLPPSRVAAMIGRVRAQSARRWPYLLWLASSSALLAVACAYDPYVFGFAALAACWISGLLVAASLLLSMRRLVLALVASIPSVVSLALLSTYNWA
jgi:hypothetical protein